MSEQKPTVGRIVHFYNTSLAAPVGHSHTGINLNGQGAGPYPALVIQDFPGPYVNLLVHAWGGDWREGSVSEKSETNASRYWEWPPHLTRA
jgi:hypothetical protein